MIIEPRVRGFICMNAHPEGCAANVGGADRPCPRAWPHRRRPALGAGGGRLDRLRAGVAHRRRIRLRRAHGRRVLRTARLREAVRLGRLVQHRGVRAGGGRGRPGRVELQRRRLRRRGQGTRPGPDPHAPGRLGRSGRLQPRLPAPRAPGERRSLQLGHQADRRAVRGQDHRRPVGRPGRRPHRAGERAGGRAHRGGDGRRRLAALDRRAGGGGGADAGVPHPCLYLPGPRAHVADLPRRHHRQGQGGPAADRRRAGCAAASTRRPGAAVGQPRAGDAGQRRDPDGRGLPGHAGAVAARAGHGRGVHRADGPPVPGEAVRWRRHPRGRCRPHPAGRLRDGGCGGRRR